MLELKDVIHHHLGCVIQTPEGFGRFLAMYAECPEPVVCADTVKSDWEVDDVKPVLRQIKNITPEKFKDIWNIATVNLASLSEEIDAVRKWETEKRAHTTAYLLQHHYDVFGLIERGLAVDVATLEVNPYDVLAPRIVVESPQRSEDL